LSTVPLSVEALVEKLGLEPHPLEGGHFRETYRSHEVARAAGLPDRYGGDRALGTAIYYLLTPSTFSAMHRLASDEIFHFYLGDRVEMLLLRPDGSSTVARLGQALEAGDVVQLVVPAKTFMGAHLAAGGRFALLGTTVAPGFEYGDYEAGDREALAARHPDRAELIARLSLPTSGGTPRFE
jgi:uncharacterized protein